VIGDTSRLLAAMPTDNGSLERQSPPTERVIAVINLLTAHPDRRFTLTEIISQLDITKATCHVLLKSLTQAGYLVRHPDKTYTLGPALIAAGRVAQKSFSALGSARPEMEKLAERFRAVVSAAAIVGDELVIVERVGPDDPSDHLQVGHRIPLIPPLGMPFMAWADKATFEHWLKRSPGGHLKGEHMRWEQVAEGVRQLGYGVERMSESSGRIRSLVGELVDDQLSLSVRNLLAHLVEEIGPDHYLPKEILNGDRKPVSVIYAPVLDEHSRAEISIALNVFREMSSRQIQQAGNALAETGRRLASTLGLRDAPTGSRSAS